MNAFRTFDSSNAVPVTDGTLERVTRVARALGVTLAELFAPFGKPFALRFRKVRRVKRR